MLKKHSIRFVYMSLCPAHDKNNCLRNMNTEQGTLNVEFSR